MKINTEEFIINANKVHNNKYDYSLTNSQFQKKETSNP